MMHSTTSQAPDKIGEILSPQISKIGRYAIKYTGQNKCYLILHGPSNEWNYQCRLIAVQLNLPFLSNPYARWLAGLHG